MFLDKIWILVALFPKRQAFVKNTQGGEKVRSDLGEKDEGLRWHLLEPFVLGAVLWEHDHRSLSNLFPAKPD